MRATIFHRCYASGNGDFISTVQKTGESAKRWLSNTYLELASCSIDYFSNHLCPYRIVMDLT